MIKINNRYFYDDGTVICNESAIVELLYAGNDIDKVVAYPTDDVNLYNAVDQFLDTQFGSIETATSELYQNVDWFSYWITPEPYNAIDIRDFILNKCKSEKELIRAEQELELFEHRNMFPIIRHLIYLVNHWREQKIVWGVGRGSSVSSFILFLVGINRINPLDYDLEIDEFIK